MRFSSQSELSSRTPRAVKRLLILMGLSALLWTSTVTWIYQTCEACGLHATYFRENFHEDWERYRDALQNGNNQRYARNLVTELLTIIRFTDAYNDAPDSPPWMHFQEGRETARNSAAEILFDMVYDLKVKHVLPTIWEALENDIRFATPEKKKAYEKVLEAQNKIHAIEEELLTALSKYAVKNTGITVNERELLDAWRDLLALVGAGSKREARAVAAGGWQMPPWPHRKAKAGEGVKGRSRSRSRITSLMYDRTRYRAEASNDARVQELRKALTEAQKEKVAAMKVYSEFRAKDRMAFGASDMVQAESYRADLEALIVRIGQPALKLLTKKIKDKNPDVARTAMRLGREISRARSAPQPTDLKKVEGLTVRRLRVAIYLWDSGHEDPKSPIAEAALKKLKAQGDLMVPDVLTIMNIKEMNLRKECARVLQLATGEKLGEDPRAWNEWYRRKFGKAAVPEREPEDEEVDEDEQTNKLVSMIKGKKGDEGTKKGPRTPAEPRKARPNPQDDLEDEEDVVAEKPRPATSAPKKNEKQPAPRVESSKRSDGEQKPDRITRPSEANPFRDEKAKLLTALESDDPRERLSAVKNLGPHGNDEKVFAALVEALLEPDAAVNTEALVAIKRGNHPLAGDAILIKIYDEDPTQRAMALKLMPVNHPRAGIAIADGLTDESVGNRRAAAKRLVALFDAAPQWGDDARLRKALSGALRGPDGEVRSLTSEAMKELNSDWAKKELAEVSPRKDKGRAKKKKSRTDGRGAVFGGFDE